MNTTDLTSALGMEKVQRAVTLLMIQNLNDAIDDQNTLWAAKDATFFAAIERDQEPFECENIAADHFYSGTIPSLIEKPMEDYPNLCVIAYISTPTLLSSDYVERYAITLAVEIMVKSETSEEEVNARIQRTLEAANYVMTSEKNRRIPEGNDGNPLVPQISRGPSATIGDVFVKHKGQDPDARWFYQGGSLTYLIEKFAPY
jgi:hypothetical protein